MFLRCTINFIDLNFYSKFLFSLKLKLIFSLFYYLWEHPLQAANSIQLFLVMRIKEIHKIIPLELIDETKYSTLNEPTNFDEQTKPTKCVNDRWPNSHSFTQQSWDSLCILYCTLYVQIICIGSDDLALSTGDPRKKFTLLISARNMQKIDLK